jgi:hypothetical protein
MAPVSGPFAPALNKGLILNPLPASRGPNWANFELIGIPASLYPRYSAISTWRRLQLSGDTSSAIITLAEPYEPSYQYCRAVSHHSAVLVLAEWYEVSWSVAPCTVTSRAEGCTIPISSDTLLYRVTGWATPLSLDDMSHLLSACI